MSIRDLGFQTLVTHLCIHVLKALNHLVLGFRSVSKSSLCVLHPLVFGDFGDLISRFVDQAS